MFTSLLKPVMHTKVKVDKTNELFRLIEELTKTDVLVGIPQEKRTRKSQEVNNAELAYLHTHGCPARNIPARPFLIPALDAHSEELGEQEGKILKALFSAQTKNATLGPYASVGNRANVMREMKRLGQMGQNYVKAWFEDPRNGWPPNAPSTIARKTKKWSRAGAPLALPLIDTSQMRNAVSYVIRGKNATS